MKKTRTGVMIAAFWLVMMFIIGAWVPTLPPEKIKLEDQPINLPKVTKPELVADRDQSVQIMNVARQIPRDFNYLIKQYDQIAPFNPHRDPHLTADQVERYIIAFDSYRDEMSNFSNQTVGEGAGVFRVLAFAGMINNYYQVVRMRALVRVNMTGEEFEWVRVRIMEAGLFAVLSALEDGQYESPQQKEHLEGLKHSMMLAVGALKDNGDNTFEDHPEKYNRLAVPQSNITLFLDYYRRPNKSGINWPKIHFHKPTTITFNRETIMAKAAMNPP